MASKVNTKFVVVVSVAVVVFLGGMLAAARFLLFKSDTQLAAEGDRAMERGDYELATLSYSKAVSKNKTSTEYLNKWRNALLKTTPGAQVKYTEAWGNYQNVIRQLAIVQKESIPAQREYLELLGRQALSGPYNRENNDFVLRECDTILAYHQGKPAGGEWETLRRYRGLAKVRAYFANPDSKGDLASAGTDDLVAAFGASHDTDSQVGLTLETVLMARANEARRLGKTDDAAQLDAQVADIVARVNAANPNTPAVLLAQIWRDLAMAVKKFQEDSRTAPQDTRKAAEEFKKQNLPRLDAAFGAAKALAPEKLDVDLIAQFRDTESALDPGAKYSRTEELVRLALEKNPNSADLILARAELASLREDFASGIAQLQTVVDMPEPPLCYDGLKLFDQKVQARFIQALWSVKVWQRTAEGPAKEAALAAIKDRREKLAGVVAKDQPRMMLIDAWLAYIDQDYQRSNQLLGQYHRATRDSDPEALYLSAQVAISLNQLGAAEQRLLQCRKLAPTSIPAITLLARVEMGMQNTERAASLVNEALQLAPENPTLLEMKKTLQALLDPKAKLSNAALQLVLDADRLDKQLETDNDPKRNEKMRDFLSAGLEPNKFDPAIVQALVNVYLRMGDRDSAMGVVKQAITANPDNKTLQSLRIALSTSDPVEAKLALIRAQEGPELDRSIQCYAVLRQAGRDADAKAELAKAVQIDAKDARVIEAEFMEAAEAKDWAGAEKFAEEAKKVDADKCGGRTFTARLQAGKGMTIDAIRTMEEVTASGGAQPEAYRLLGRLQVVVGRNSDAANSMRSALQLRPNDVPCINDLLRVLVGLDRKEEALALARNSRKYAESDREFYNMWLELENMIGDKALALRTREQVARADPTDRANRMALARLYVDARRWDDARKVIDDIRKAQDGLDAVALDAGWYWSKGDQDKARAVFEGYLKAKPDLDSTMFYARFLLDSGDADGCLRVLDGARAMQDPKTLQVDRIMANTLFSLGRLKEAAEKLAVVVAAGGEDEPVYRKRLVESLVKTNEPDAAQKAIEPLMGVPSPDAVTLLLASDIKGVQKDKKGQLELLNRAVGQFPSDPVVFMKRAQVTMQDDKTLRDALEDLNKSVQLDQSNPQAYRLRALIKVQMHSLDDALVDLRQALKLNPSDTGLLLGLVSDLVRMGRESEAETVASDALQSRDRDDRLYASVGAIFLRGNKPTIAQQFFKHAFELNSADIIAQNYLDSLLDAPQPSVNEAERVMQVLGGRVEQSPGFTLARAKIRMAQGRGAEAARFAVDALRMITPDNPTLMIAWFNDVRKLQPDTTRQVKFFDDVGNANVANVGDWLKYFRAFVKYNNESAKEESLRELDELSRKASNPAIQILSSKLLGARQYQLGRFQEAVTTMRQTLTLAPDDAETLNNIAYILARKMNQPAEALEMSEKANKAQPANPEIMDTYGTIQYLSGKPQEAIKTLERAAYLATEPNTIVSIAAHLGEALIQTGDKARAAEVLSRVTDLLGSDRATIDQPTREEFEQTKAKLAK